MRGMTASNQGHLEEGVGEESDARPEGPGRGDVAALPCEDLGSTGILAARLVVEGAKGVAKNQSVSLRTLQRRLAAKGTNVRRSLSTYRQAQTLKLLRSGLKIGEIAREVGFSSGEAFSRFCRRELGATATELRRRGERLPPPRTARTGMARKGDFLERAILTISARGSSRRETAQERIEGGSFRLTGYEPGSYMVRAVGGGRVSETVPVEIADDGSSPFLRIVALPRTVVDLRLVTEAGSPVPIPGYRPWRIQPLSARAWIPERAGCLFTGLPRSVRHTHAQGAARQLS